MSTNQVIYPYSRIQRLRLDVVFIVDADTGAALPEIEMPDPEDYGQPEIGLPSGPWETLRIGLEIRLEADLLGEVVPDPTLAADELAALVSVRCSATKNRRGIRLESSGEGVWSSSIVIPRSDIAGVTELAPTLVRVKDDSSAGEQTGFATFTGAILGEGTPVALVLERAPRLTDSDFSYKWEDFRHSTNPWIASRGDDVYYIDPQDVPRVHLNLRWASLQPILDTKAFVGMPAALKFTYSSAIAQAGWLQLLATAVASIREEDGEWNVLGSPWRADLVDRIGALKYPDESESDRRRLLHQHFSDFSEVGALMSQLGSYAHDLSKMGTHFERAAKVVDTRQGIPTEEEA